MEPVITNCPKCGHVTEHQLLKPGENSMTVKCDDCGDVRTITPPRVRIIDLKLVISDEDKARNGRMEVPRDEVVAVGLEFDLDDERMIVTGIEVEGKTTKKAKAEDIKILHAKVFNTVALKFSLNEDDKTRSFRMDVDPDTPVSVGEVFKVDETLMIVKTIKSDQNRTLHRGFLMARNIVRVFCDPAPWKAKKGQIITARRRGAPPSRRSKPTSRVKAPRSAGPRRR